MSFKPCRTLPLLVLLSLSGLPACAPEPAEVPAAEPAINTPATPQQAYVSNIQVSTDCGVGTIPTAAPGLAEPVGRKLRDMPERIAKMQAVGADRPLADTDFERVSPGYIVIDPNDMSESLIIDNAKNVVASFTGDYPILLSQILPNGNRLVSSGGYSEPFVDGGGHRGCMEEYAPDGTLVWRLNLNDARFMHHHDVIKLPNGNVLAAVWERVPAAEAVSQGRDPERVAENGNHWYDWVVEIDPYTATVVWEWSTKHHLVQDFDPGKSNYGVLADHPGLLDINAIEPRMKGEIDDDWTHVNAIDYNPELDQIAISSNYLSEIWIIDHSTTPWESAGHTGGRYGRGGDFLYRWGHPERYDRGTAEDRTLFNQHDVQWIKPGLPGEGHLLIFNNGDPKLRRHSTVVEIAPEMNADGSYVLRGSAAFGPESLAWEYNPEAPERFFSFFISGAQRLPNGNTLVNHGAGGKVREVTSMGEIVWEYEYRNEVDAAHMLFRANRYPPDHPGIVEILKHSQ